MPGKEGGVDIEHEAVTLNVAVAVNDQVALSESLLLVLLHTEHDIPDVVQILGEAHSKSDTEALAVALIEMVSVEVAVAATETDKDLVRVGKEVRVQLPVIVPEYDADTDHVELPVRDAEGA